VDPCRPRRSAQSNGRSGDERPRGSTKRRCQTAPSRGVLESALSGANSGGFRRVDADHSRGAPRCEDDTRASVRGTCLAERLCNGARVRDAMPNGRRDEDSRDEERCEMRTEVTSRQPAGPNARSLPQTDLAKIDALWRAANYLSVGQIYLLDNPLLKKPLSRE